MRAGEIRHCGEEDLRGGVRWRVLDKACRLTAVATFLLCSRPATAVTCTPSETAACLQGGRFEVTVEWSTGSSQGAGRLMSFDGRRAATEDSAFFWFCSPTNFEMGLKVLDACEPALGNRYWVFVSGLTDQGWTVRVRDLASGLERTYTNPVGTLSTTFRDTATFNCFGPG